MSAFLTDTLLWTGALLALVLLIRRPVAELFGPSAAYALWALPMGRLLLPPLVLPAWMAPAPEPVAMIELAVEAPLAAIESAPMAAAPALAEPLIDWSALLLALWLAGAAVFLARRYSLYFKMRRELLEAARPMGEAGRVRLVETPAADGPVAFGVIDKVIALPMGFMAGHDRAARDLALAHELAHHRGRDLLCNMLVQPLFALHWFNPLSVLGWRALRRDQEAACDARVMACEPRERRAQYAAVITRFATQPRPAARLALAAPMACPVLGDRSIVQRLKSLAKTELSARRRWAGRVLIAAGAVALPLTGSISYAQSDIAPPEPVAPPAPPAPVAPPAAVTAPTPPEAPSVTVSDDGKVRIVRVERLNDDDGDDEDGKRIERRIVVRPGPHPRIVVHPGAQMSAEERAEFEQEMAEMRRELAEEQGEVARELQRELGENSEFQREMREHFGENGELQREIRVAVANARVHAAAAVASAPVVVQRCRSGQREVTETVVAKDGRQHMYVCQAVAMADARKAIAAARADIARARKDVQGARGMTAFEREQALRSLERAEQNLRAH